MEYTEYQRRVLARASTEWHKDAIGMFMLRDVLQEFIKQGYRLDRVKKALFYGRDFGVGVLQDSPVEAPSAREQQLIHAALGFATEGVELVEALLAYWFEHKPFDVTNLREEFGDGEWYRALGLDALGQSHEANLEQNDRKLEARYGATFTAERANNRDLETERKTLEG